MTAGSGLAGGGTGANVTLSLRTAANGAFDLSNSGGLLASLDAQGGGTLPAQGPGRRFHYYPGKDAFRIGQVTGAQWDDASIGSYSLAAGFDTTASGEWSVAVGRFSIASGNPSFAAGNDARATGGFGAASLGDRTSAGGDSSVALGHRAVTLDAADGSFVFADRSSTNSFTSFAPNEFLVRAASGVGFYTNAAATTGLYIAPSGSQWLGISDVHAKRDFRALDGEYVLGQLARMPIQEWSYKAQDPSIRHAGPTAQDFHAAFGLGEDPLRIGTMDADGVALAAIKALEARTRVLTQENEELRRALGELRAMLDSLRTPRP